MDETEFPDLESAIQAQREAMRELDKAVAKPGAWSDYLQRGAALLNLTRLEGMAMIVPGETTDVDETPQLAAYLDQAISDLARAYDLSQQAPPDDGRRMWAEIQWMLASALFDRGRVVEAGQVLDALFERLVIESNATNGQVNIAVMMHPLEELRAQMHILSVRIKTALQDITEEDLLALLEVADEYDIPALTEEALEVLDAAGYGDWAREVVAQYEQEPHLPPPTLQ